MTAVTIDGQKYQKANPQHKDWETPPDFFRALDKEFHFTLDAAASHDNALCDWYCTQGGTYLKTENGPVEHSGRDGLAYPWSGMRVFCNPPYDSTLYQWVEKAAKREADVAVLLLPPSIDTKWFHDFIYPWASMNVEEYGKVEVRFLRGRLRFWHDGKPGMAPRAGNLLVIFRR